MAFNFSEDVLARNPQLKAELMTTPPSKYHNARTEARGMTFQSGHEAAIIGALIVAEEHQAGVFALRLQVRFPLSKKIVYVADAVYLDEKLEVHVLDAKGVKTREYQLKKKLFRERYGRDIEEV